MASISVIRTRLAANLGTISGLRTSAEMPDNPTPPIGIINLDSVDYDGAMQGGLTTYSFVVMVVVGRAAEREMQRKLDAYCDPTGSQSVKLAIESDKTLSGEVYDLRVERSSGMGSIIINDQNYLAAEFTVTVLG
jgi:hypothetical protein|tara:strand:+ start:2681 stop:3085 length:405 start_codon:yes stop_codon:yes gene_type:complete